MKKDEWIMIDGSCQAQQLSLPRDFQIHLQLAIIRSLQRSDMLSKAQSDKFIENLYADRHIHG